jgi:hypothetical protein
MSEENKVEDIEIDELEKEIIGASEEEVIEEEIVEEEVIDKKAEEDPEKKPEEAVVPEIKEEPEVVEEEVKPDNSAYARMRHNEKEALKRVAELEEQLSPKSEAVKDTVDKLVKAWEDGDDGKALLSSIRKASSQDLQAIWEGAAKGEYGDSSDDVITMIAREMPMIQNRETAKTAEAQTQRDEILSAINAEAEQAKADFPKFAVEGSDEAKALEGFTTKAIGTLDLKTGELDGLGNMPDDLAMYLHSHPYALQQLASNTFTAQTENSKVSMAKEAALTKEVATLKKSLEQYTTLGSPSAAKDTQKSSANTPDELELEILS